MTSCVFFDVSLFDSIVSAAKGASVRGLGIEQLSVCFASTQKQKTLHRSNFQASMKRNFCFLEKLFDVTITVFELREDKSSTVLWNSGKQTGS